jgi:hypothetical protein
MKKFIKDSNIKKHIKDLLEVTPKEWASLRNKSLALAAAATAGWQAVMAIPNLSLGGWDKAFGGFIAAMIFIATYAQSKRE